MSWTSRNSKALNALDALDEGRRGLRIVGDKVETPGEMLLTKT